MLTRVRARGARALDVRSSPLLREMGAIWDGSARHSLQVVNRLGRVQELASLAIDGNEHHTTRTKLMEQCKGELIPFITMFSVRKVIVVIMSRDVL